MLYCLIAVGIGIVIGYIIGIGAVHNLYHMGSLEIAEHEGYRFTVLKLTKELEEISRKKYILLRVENTSYYEN